MSAPQQVPLETPTRPGGPPPWSDEVGGWHKYMETHPNVHVRALNEKYVNLYNEMTSDGWPRKLEEILMKPGINWFEGLQLQGCVCIGIGSFARDLVPIKDYPAEDYFDRAENMFKYRPPAAVHGPHRDKSMYRLIFLVMLLTLLRTKYGNLETSFYDQPFFGRADKEFLEALDFKLVHASFTTTAELINPCTLYYAPGASANVLETVLKRCHPALYIGTPLQDVLKGLDDPTGQLPTKPLLESYMKVTDFVLNPPFNYKTEQESKALGHEIRWLRSQEQTKAWDDLYKKLSPY